MKRFKEFNRILKEADSKNGVVSSVNLYFLYIKELPEFFKDLTVTHFFDCQRNQLKSLKNCPQKIGSYFDCSFNQLTSLEGGPEYVGGNFYCNKNKLTSLEGCPEYVGKNFNCDDNPVKFTEDYVRSLINIGGTLFL